jgi:hypothetical protein
MKAEEPRPFVCPPEVKLDVDLDLTTTDGTTLLIS